MMPSLAVCILILGQIYASQALLDSKYLTDIYNIYKGIAVAARNWTGGQVYPENVTFYLYDIEDTKHYHAIDGLSSKWSNVTDPEIQYVFIIHGWLEDKEVGWYEDLKNAFFKRGDNYVVIQVDWSGPANEVYGISSVNTKDVGYVVGDVIVKLVEENHIPLKNFHVVGHSLGGQVAGFAGKRFYAKTGKRLPRITALDPAGPFFVTRADDDKLNKQDADVVFVIHTNGGTFGYKRPVGTIDLFPNGGRVQPGCASVDLARISSWTKLVPCDHQRSWGYFIEAVRHPHRFLARRCVIRRRYIIFRRLECFDDDMVTMGDLVTIKRGNYHLKTNGERPFGKRVKLL